MLRKLRAYINYWKNEPPKFPSRKYFLGVLVLFILLGAGVGVVIYFLLNHFSPYDASATNAGSQSEHIYDLVRTTATILGVITVGGAAAVQYRKQRFMEASAALERDAKLVERDSKFSALLTKAIEHLGHDSVSIRKGALYELKRLAIDSEKDRGDVLEIIAEFISENRNKQALILEKPTVAAIDSDVLTAEKILDYLLGNSNLNIRELNFSGMNLSKIKLDKANLDRVDLSGATLIGANLSRMNLNGAILFGANLRGAALFRTCSCGANLRSADFRKATLIGAKLNKAVLDWADFRGANLSGATVTAEQLKFARIDETTILDDDIREELVRRGKLEPKKE